MSCYIDVVGCTNNDDHNGIDKGDCPYCEIDRLSAQLAERDREIARLREKVLWPPNPSTWTVIRITELNKLEAENSALRAEVERLKIELEDEQVLASERKIIIDAHTRQTERYENIYRREFEARQQLKAAEEEIRYLDARIADTRKQAAQECVTIIETKCNQWLEKHRLDASWQSLAANEIRQRYGLEVE